MTLQTAFFPLADLLPKGAAVLIVATILDALLRRTSAANRSALWSRPPSGTRESVGVGREFFGGVSRF